MTGGTMRFVVLATIIALLSALGLQLPLVEAEPIKLMELMLSQSRAQQAAWIIVALVPLVLMFVALLEHEKLRRERQTNDLLGTRFYGVRESLSLRRSRLRRRERLANAEITEADRRR